MGSGAVGVESPSNLPPFRQRGDDSRAAAAPRTVEGRGRSAELEKSFRKQGITSHTGARVTAPRARRRRRHRRAARRRHAKKLRADYCSWRRRGPVTDGLNADGVGLQIEKGYVRSTHSTDERAGISAIGDVITLGTPDIRSWRTCPRPKASAAERIAGRIYGRSTTITSRVHVLRPGNRQRRLTTRGEGARIRRSRSARFRSACSAAPRWRARPTASSRLSPIRRYDEVLGVHMIGARSTELVAEATVALRLECDRRGTDSHDSRASDNGEAVARPRMPRMARPYTVISLQAQFESRSECAIEN
jgi:dihydrolipoamide dehydrogenase